MNHSGLSIPKKYMKDLEMISINGKLCLTKLEKIEKPLITVRHKRHLGQSLSIIGLFFIK